MATTKKGFQYVQTLTDQDIIEQARIIADASKKIEEIKEQQKQIKELQKTIVTHSKYIQEGAVSGWSYGVFEWNKPVHGVVTVSFDEERRMYGYTPFPTFVRDMTEEELKEHCELEIPFDQEEESEQKTFLHTVVHPYMIEYNKSALAFVVSIENNGRRDFLRSFLKFEEALDFVNQRRELEKPNTFEAPTEALARKIKSIAMEAEDAGMIDIPQETDDEQDISEIFGIATNDDPPQPDSTQTPELEPTPEYPSPVYRIEQCESTKYPWNILEGSGKDAVIFERFRTREEAETFLTLFNENKIPENSPGTEWIMEKGLGGWKVKKCEYENGRLLKSTFHTMVVCYFEAKQMCENFNSGIIPSEMKIVSENDRYQIVENPDGSLKTILKTNEEEVKA